MRAWTITAALVALALCSCERQPPKPPPTPQAPSPQKEQPEPDEPPDAPEARPAPPAPERPAWRREAPARLVAVGDVHGDLGALREALRGADLIDAQHDWVGSEAVLVQTGDLLDRGDQEREIIDWLDALGEQAREAGGDVVELVGNHEIMNVQGDMRYVTPDGFADFVGVPGLELSDPRLERVPSKARARVAAFVPGGPYARKLAAHNTIAVVGDSVFVHGGVLPEHVAYGIGRLNREVSQWMAGQGPPPVILRGEDSPVWTRLYSSEPDEAACQTLARALGELGAERMVVGHTPQMGGISSACDGKIWRVDVGMSAHYGGQPAALEIRPGAPPEPTSPAQK